MTTTPTTKDTTMQDTQIVCFLHARPAFKAARGISEQRFLEDLYRRRLAAMVADASGSGSSVAFTDDIVPSEDVTATSPTALVALREVERIAERELALAGYHDPITVPRLDWGAAMAHDQIAATVSVRGGALVGVVVARLDYPSDNKGRSLVSRSGDLKDVGRATLDEILFEVHRACLLAVTSFDLAMPDQAEREAFELAALTLARKTDQVPDAAAWVATPLPGDAKPSLCQRAAYYSWLTRLVAK